jgi:hypothetical protein
VASLEDRYHERLTRAESERNDAMAELERLREALDDAAEYLRLGSTWIVDTDRHDKMRRAEQRARDARNA